eukprot:gene10927-17041_t
MAGLAEDGRGLRWPLGPNSGSGSGGVSGSSGVSGVLVPELLFFPFDASVPLYGYEDDDDSSSGVGAAPSGADAIPETDLAISFSIKRDFTFQPDILTGATVSARRIPKYRIGTAV